MKKITLLLALFALQFCFSQVPDYTWARNLPLYFNSKTNFTAVDPSGNTYVISDFSSPTVTIGGITLNNNSVADYADLMLIKYNRQGTVVWAKSFGGPRNDSVTDIVADQSGNIYIIGVFHTSIAFGATTLTSSSTGSYLAKLDGNGNTIFAKKYYTDGNQIAGITLNVDANNSIYIAGIFRDPTAVFGNIVLNYENYVVGANNTNRTFVAKIDALGNFLWVKGINSDPTNFIGNAPSSVTSDAFGNVYVCGQFYSSTIRTDAITLTKTANLEFNANMFVIKYDASGNALWGKNTGSMYANSTSANTVVTDATGNAYVSGYFPNIISFGAFNLVSSGGSQMYTVKFAPNGTPLWAKKPSSPFGYNNIQSSKVDSQGNLYVAGTFTNEEIDFGNNVQLTYPFSGSAFIVKYSPQGIAQWARMTGEMDANNEISLALWNENELYLSGTFNSQVLGFNNLSVIKTQTNYNVFVARLFYEPTMGTKTFSATNNRVYPNPTTDFLSVNKLQEECSYKLYSLLGSLLQEGTINEGNKIDISQQSAGTYLLQLTNNNGESFSHKVVKN